MTGYGRVQLEDNGDNIIVELKSVNHKYQKVYLHIPEQLSILEVKINKLLKGALSRGRVDYNLKIQSVNQKRLKVKVNQLLVKEYLESLEQLKTEFGLAQAEELSIEFLAGLPEVLELEELGPDLETLWPQVKEATELALAELLAMKKREGEELLADFLDRLDSIESLTEQIEERIPKIVLKYRLKLQKRLEDLIADHEIDEERLAIETAVIADKSDVNEELIRIKSHLSQFAETLKGEEDSVGRKLDFIAQEMHREINTIGSKVSDSEVTKHVVDLKSEVDKIREQVQNIE